MGDVWVVRMKKTLYSLVLTSAMMLPSYGLAEDVVRKLSLSGSAQVEVIPDEAELHLSVVTEQKEAQGAYDQNATLSQKVVSALKDAGADVETVGYSGHKNEVYENNVLVMKGYKVVHSFRVRTKKLDQVGKLQALGVANGAYDTGGVHFTLSTEKEKEVKYSLLEKACEDAKAKADVVAKAFQGYRGRVLELTISSYDGPHYPVYAPAALKSAVGVEPPIEAKKVSTRASINVVFELGYMPSENQEF